MWSCKKSFIWQTCACSWYHAKKFQVEDKAYKLCKVQTSMWSCKNGFIWQTCACSWYHAKKFQAKTSPTSFVKFKLLCGVAKTTSFDKHVLALDIMQRNFK
jgi:hypothetical protein